MRKLLVGIAAVAVLLSFGLAYADTGKVDGLINLEGGSQGSSSWSYHPNVHLPHGACETFAELNGGGSWSGIYDYDDYKWFCETSTGEQNISITCDIEMYCTVTLDKTDVYFHIAQPTTYMEAIITGSLMSNNGQYLGIIIPGQSEKVLIPENPVLVFQEDGFGRTLANMSTQAKAEHADIPLSLEFRYYDGTSWSSWDTGQWEWGNNNQDLAWWWGGVPMASSHGFQIKVDIKPMEHQGDGRYVVDPIVVLAPVL